MSWVDGLAGAGKLLGGIGSIYGAYSQNKIGKEMLKLQKSYLNDEKKRRKKNQARLDYAAESTLGKSNNDNARLNY